MKLFLAKITNSDDRDCVHYLDTNTGNFECGHYFSGLRICGANFSGTFDMEKIVNDKFEKLETILTQEEFKRLFEFDEKISKLGYGITMGDIRFHKGQSIVNSIKDIITKLKSDENTALFNKIINDEKEWCMREYDLSKNEVKTIFSEYRAEYQDRGIICYIFKDKNEMLYEEKCSLGYDEIPYFDDKAFLNDLLDDDSCLRLKSGKIIRFSY